MSKWTSIRDSTLGLLGAVAPTIAKTLGGPLAGVAVGALSKALLGKDGGTAAEIDAALAAASPEVIAAVRKADQDFEAEMGRQGIDLERINAADRDSARDREIKTGDKTPARLAFFVTVGFFGILCYLLKYGLPSDGGDALLIMLGSLGTAWTGIVAYYFGSSAGSKAKTDALASKVAK